MRGPISRHRRSLLLNFHANSCSQFPCLIRGCEAVPAVLTAPFAAAISATKKFSSGFRCSACLTSASGVSANALAHTSRMALAERIWFVYKSTLVRKKMGEAHNASALWRRMKPERRRCADTPRLRSVVRRAEADDRSRRAIHPVRIAHWSERKQMQQKRRRYPR